MKVKKSDLVNAWNEIEEVITDLEDLSPDEFINVIDTVQNRLVTAQELLGKYVTEKDLQKGNII